MTLYCRNGHRVGPDVIWDAGSGTGFFCPICRASLSTYVQDDRVPLWPVVLVVIVALILVGGLWWWMWLAPR